MNNIDVARLLIISIILCISYYLIKKNNGISINKYTVACIILVISIVFVISLGLSFSALGEFGGIVCIFIDFVLHFIKGVKMRRKSTESGFITLQSFFIVFVLATIWYPIYSKING